MFRTVVLGFLLPPVVASSLVGLLVAGFSLWSDSANFHGHAAGHWLMAIPILFVTVMFVRLPGARTAPRRMARLFLTIALVVLPASLLLEGVGAFASGGGAFDGVIEPLHGLGEAGTLFATFFLPLSLAVVTVVYLFAGVRALMTSSSS